MSTHEPSRWALSRYLLGGYGVFTVVAWVPFFVVVMLAAWALDRFATLESSVWEPATVIVRLYLLVILHHIVTIHFPLHIASGGTRRGFLRQLGSFVGLFAAFLVVLTTAGFRLEAVVAGWMGWAVPVTSYTFFDSAEQMVEIGLTYLAIFLVWGTASVLGSVSIYRNRDAGGLGFLGALAMVLVAESSFGTDFLFLGFIARNLELDRWSLAASVVIAGGIAVVGMATTWLVGRDLPVGSPR